MTADDAPTGGALEDLFDQIDMVEVDEDLIRKADDLAEDQGLRAYDAVHLAAAVRVDDVDLVVVAGDRALLAAATTVGMSVAAMSDVCGDHGGDHRHREEIEAAIAALRA